MKKNDPGDLLKKVHAYILDHTMFSPGQTVLVAVSGGPDSVCLLDLLARLRDPLGIRLCVAHLNHRLRGRASDADARFVRRLARKMDLPCETGVCDVEALARAEGRSLEDAARQARYRFLGEVRRRVGAARVALGHTRSDQAETVLFRLIRGSGSTGLAAMRPVRDGLYVRPLLNVSREEVERYAALRRLTFRRDATNRDRRFTRNRLRRDLLPRLRRDYNPDVEGALARAAALLAAEDEWLEKLARRAFSRGRLPSPSGKIVLDVKRFLGYHLALQRRVLRLAILDLGGTGDSLSFESVGRILEAFGRPASVFQVPEEIRVSSTPDAVILARPTPAFEVAVRIPGRTAVPQLNLVLSARIPPESEWREACRRARSDEAFLDLRFLTGKTTLRSLRKGDRLQPLGMAGTRKVSDLLIDAGIPRLLRDSVPALVSGGEILWVVGQRISHAARVTSRTEQVVHIQTRRLRVRPSPSPDAGGKPCDPLPLPTLGEGGGIQPVSSDGGG